MKANIALIVQNTCTLRLCVDCNLMSLVLPIVVASAVASAIRRWIRSTNAGNAGDAESVVGRNESRASPRHWTGDGDVWNRRTLSLAKERRRMRTFQIRHCTVEDCA